MNPTGLLNQSLTIYSKTSYDAYGREVVGSGTTVKARVQETTKQKLLPNNSLITINAIAYVPAETTVEIDDRVDVGGVKYKVYGKYSAVDDVGAVNHIRLELTKWRET